MAGENEGAGAGAAAGGAAAGGGEGAGGGIFEGVNVSEPNETTAPAAQTPEAGAAEPAAGAQGAAEPAGEGQTPGAEGEQPKVEEPAAPKKLWAGQFERPEDMEVALKHSSTEGRRLYKELVAREGELKAMSAQLEELSAKLKEGPAFQELTAEQLAEMDPDAKAQYFAKREVHAIRAEQAKRDQAQAKEREQQARTQLVTGINARIDFMAAHPEQFPDYQELGPVMDDLLEKAPWLAGRPETPDVLYEIAYARRARAAEAASKKASAAAEEKRKKESAAAGSRAGSMGPTPGGKGPAKKPAPGSDEAHNALIIAAGAKKNYF